MKQTTGAMEEIQRSEGPRTTKPLAGWLTVLAVCGLTACAAAPTANGPSTATAPENAAVAAIDVTDSDARIAGNLVAVIAQIDEIPPWSSTIQINEPTSSFGAALFTAFEGVGYGVQRVPEDQGSNYISYRTSSRQTESGSVFTYTLWVGGRISLERRFRDVGGQLLPVSPITMTGVQPRTLKIDDSDYLRSISAGQEFPSGIEFRDEGFELLRSDLRTLITAGTGSSAGSSGSARIGQSVRARLETYRPKRQATLSFPTIADNVLGDANKQAIVAISEAFDASTDLFLVSGCRPPSFTGPADPVDEAMARTDRVKSELLTRGHADDIVLVENCEPGRYNTDLPPRSVILTLERLRDI